MLEIAAVSVIIMFCLMLLTDKRKKVLTDPRLSKSKSPSSSAIRWYTGGDEDTETTPSMSHGGGSGHPHHATANELSPPLIGFDDASSVSTREYY